MSAFHMILEIEQRAHKPGAGSEPYLLELLLRSGRKIICAPKSSNSYFLTVQVQIEAEKAFCRTTYISYDAIDQITPLWLSSK